MLVTHAFLVRALQICYQTHHGFKATETDLYKDKSHIVTLLLVPFRLTNFGLEPLMIIYGLVGKICARVCCAKI